MGKRLNVFIAKEAYDVIKMYQTVNDHPNLDTALEQFILEHRHKDKKSEWETIHRWSTITKRNLNSTRTRIHLNPSYVCFHIKQHVCEICRILPDYLVHLYMGFKDNKRKSRCMSYGKIKLQGENKSIVFQDKIFDNFCDSFGYFFAIGPSRRNQINLVCAFGIYPNIIPDQ